jgi:hypothetical protein
VKTRRRRLQKSDVFWLLAAALLILLQFWWLPGNPGAPDDSYSNSIEGKRGLFQTLDALSQAGLFPEVRRETTRLVPQQASTLLLLSPDRYPNTHEQEELADFVYDGGTLLFAPNWSDPECIISQLNIRTQGHLFIDETTATSVAPGTAGAPAAPAESTVELPAEAEESTPDTATDENATGSDTTDTNLQAEADRSAPTQAPQSTGQTDTQTQDFEQHLDEDLNNTPGLLPKQTTPLEVQDPDSEVRISSLQTESTLIKGSLRWRTRASMTTPGNRSTTLVKTSADTIQAAAWTYGDGLVVVSASPDVFSNQALLFEDQAELAIRLVEYAHAHHVARGRDNVPIVVNEFMNSSDDYRGTAVLLSPGLRSGTLQLILIAFLCGWYGFHRFGPAIRTNLKERRSLTDSAIAVGNLQFRSQGSAASVKSYLDYLKSRLRYLFAGTVRLEDHAALAHRTGLQTEDIAQRISEAERIVYTGESQPAQAAAVIRRLADIHQRLTGIKEHAKDQSH